MEATNNAGAAMAASENVTLRPAHGRGSLAAQQRRVAELLSAHLAGGGTVNAFARIHRMTSKAVAALRATLPPASTPVTITGGKPKGSITAATSAKMDALADRVAEGLDRDIKSAGAALGWPQQSASRVWLLICRELGSQAA